MIVSLTREAAEDVMLAALAYDAEREGLGAKFEMEVGRVLERIEQLPFQFPAVEQGVHRALLKTFPYAVFFVTLEDQVRVFAVLHQHRDPRSWRER